MILQVILNAHKVHKYETGASITFLQFVHDIIIQLLAPAPNVATNIPLSENVLHLNGRHFFGRDKRPTKDCRVCYARGNVTNPGRPLRTVCVCKTCPSKPGLYPEKCFKLFHTKPDYHLE